MSKIAVTIKGLDACKATMQRVLSTIETGTEVALDAVSEATLADAKQNCPVDTGKLERSLEIEKERLRRLIGTNVDYSIYVHEGTYKMKGRPFLTNAFEADKAVLPQECRKIKVI
jgi:HK97 gp10 family phage protein